MDVQTQLMAVVYVVILLVFYKKLTTYIVLLSVGVGALLYGLEMSPTISIGAAALTLGLILGLSKSSEGFNTTLDNTRAFPSNQRASSNDMVNNQKKSPTNITNNVKRIRNPRKMRRPRVNYMNSTMIEGYEDVKKEKDEKPAPALSEKEEMPTPFKLGEIPSQVKNGPHIDAASTLVKAINSLNPDQIKAMSKDTQQLIETQKSLMGMLGSMKPMLNDGKELMDTFQEMFGQ